LIKIKLLEEWVMARKAIRERNTVYGRNKKWLQCNSVVKCLLSTNEATSSIPSTTKMLIKIKTD
jgi:hypothetical protein